jgi:hypothetical protein
MGEVRMSLTDLLRMADWGPRQLVTAINARLFSQGRDRLRLDPTAAMPGSGAASGPGRRSQISLLRCSPSVSDSRLPPRSCGRAAGNPAVRNEAQPMTWMASPTLTTSCAN